MVSLLEALAAVIVHTQFIDDLYRRVVACMLETQNDRTKLQIAVNVVECYNHSSNLFAGEVHLSVVRLALRICKSCNSRARACFFVPVGAS